MAIESIGRVASSDSAATQNSVGIDDFLEIFLTQLNFQDPLEPVDNREFIAQLAQFSSLQIASETNDNLEGLLEVNSVDQAVGLIGRSVTFNGGLSGRVIAMRLQGEDLVLDIDDGSGVQRGISPVNVTLVQ
ncbi:flagellar hook capping protein [Gammaproteobacteria bacterium 45_16_T64]|nr:flagellar hook capping protein [Gammaproteobacteria bacterium 45_16_T64]